MSDTSDKRDDAQCNQLISSQNLDLESLELDDRGASNDNFNESLRKFQSRLALILRQANKP